MTKAQLNRMNKDSLWALIKALCPGADLSVSEFIGFRTVLHMRDIEVKRGIVLGSAGDNGNTPKQAMVNTLHRLTNLPQNEFIVKDAYLPTRSHWRFDNQTQSWKCIG